MSFLQVDQAKSVCVVTTKELRTALVGLVLLMLSLPAVSQVNFGRIGGAVSDVSGAVIQGATVTVTDVDRGVSRTLTTDAAGTFSAPSLNPGRYSVRAEQGGFKTVERRDITVGVGQDVRVDLTLLPGEQQQTVTVTGEAPEVNTTNAQMGGSIESKDIIDLPMNGRNYLYLLQYRPGIAMKPGGGGGAPHYTNGMRPQWNVTVFDGLPDLNAFNTAAPLGIAFIAGGPDQSTILSLDAIQEFNLVENPKAEYGWRPGAQINIGVKSGTNAIHGTAFALGRDTALDARNAFATQTTPLAFENFGGTIGGPIKKDKLFYFGSYEGQMYEVGNPKDLTVPTTAPGAGPANSFVDAIGDMLNKHGYTPTTLSALSLNLAGCSVTGAAAPYTVGCNAGKGIFGNSSASAAYPSDLLSSGSSNTALGKIDYHINDHNILNGDLYWGKGRITAPVNNAIQPWWSDPLESYADVARLVWNWIPNSTWLNDFRFGWDRSFQSADPSPDCQSGSGAPNYASLGLVTGATVCGIPSISITGFTIGNSPTVGQAAGQNTLSDSYRWADSVSYMHGKHQFKFGGEFTLNRVTGALTTNLGKGTLLFTTTNNAFTGATPLENFLAGRPASGSLQVGNPTRQVNYSQVAAYVQDDWRVTPKVTLNLGVRYEYTQPIQVANNLIGNFDPSSPTGLVQASGGNSLYHLSPYDFAPRAGIAWDITGKGTTVLRSGFGMYYYQAPVVSYFQSPAILQKMPTGYNLYGANGSSATTPGGTINLGTLSLQAPIPWALNTPIFGNYLNSTLSCGNGLAPVNPVPGAPARNPSLCSLGAVDPNLTIPKLYSWNVDLQRALTSGLSLDVAYVGNHGQETGAMDLNQPLPGTKTSTFVEQARRPYNGQFPYFGEITYLSNFEQSNYSSFQATVVQRLSHGLSFTGGYTYGHALDQSTAENNSFLVMDSRNPGLDYGNGDLDVRQRFTLAGSYAIPNKKSPGQLLEGWQLNTAVQLYSALPYTAVDTSNDLSGTGIRRDRWSLVGDPGAFQFSGRQPVPCWGVSGSSFGKVSNCTSVAVPAGATTAAQKVANMPAQCVSAANSLPVNPAVGTTGLDSLASYGCYMMGGAVIVPPAQGTYGSMGRNVLRGPGFRVWDMSVSKTWTFRERYTAEFRTELYNVLNSVQYATPSVNLAQPATFGASQATPNIQGNSPIIGTGDARRIQLGLRIGF